EKLQSAVSDFGQTAWGKARSGALNTSVAVALDHICGDNFSKLSDLYRCDKAAIQMLRFADTSYYPENVSFKKELIQLLLSDEAGKFLPEMFDAMQDSLHECGAKFKLWDFAFEYFHGNGAKALQWIAVLFHDRGPIDQLIKSMIPANRSA